MPGFLFVSYSHQDMAPVHWLNRLKQYLAPFRRHEGIEVWDDSRIKPGENWRSEIAQALGAADAAIFLVGPGLLASDFVDEIELPRLLSAASSRGVKLYPLIIGYCAYQRSALEPYQAFNGPEHPLEALVTAEQNKILNELSVAVDKAMRHPLGSHPTANLRPANDSLALEAIRRELSNTRTAFAAQCKRRDALAEAIGNRLRVESDLEYEKFFFHFYPQMNAEEKFEFSLIRNLTEGPLYQGNKKVFETLERHPELLDHYPAFIKLQQHLVFWLNKYERVFASTPEMCVLYTGVEDGVPFPSGVDLVVGAPPLDHEEGRDKKSADRRSD